ncbi:hypothetical protein ACQKNN_10090 [Bacillus paramycoides]|uniref:hypothetical protein n=1 Tax=Bacillus paramycoides TaxID=2026194 RepID=UPI003B6570F8
MAKKRADLIRFERLDRLPEYIKISCLDIADHFKVKRNYLPQFCRLINSSKVWNMDNLDTMLNGWVKNSQKIYPPKFIDMVYKAFSQCNNIEDIGDLRGALVEALVIASYGGPKVLQNPNYGWGALVKLKEEDKFDEVRYRCPQHRVGDCLHRNTVDFGYWNGYHGEFYECKVNPESIGCKEKNYMLELQEKLKNKGITYDLIFVCANHTESVQIELDRLNLDIKFKAVGYDNLFN